MTYTYTQAITPNEVQTMVMGDGQPTAYYGYDAHGDTTAITDGARLNTHVAYDSQARPVQVTFLDHTTLATMTLAYNPAGLRAEYTLAESGKTTLDERFTYRGGVLGQMQLVQGSLAYTDTYLYTEAGTPYELLRQQGGATNRYWYEVDGRGNVVALTDVNGTVVDRYAYDSWGELTSNDAVDETAPQQLRYAGYWYDEKLSWYWLSVRYYDPEIARFLAPDPSQQDGVRTYAYVADNPLGATDPTGLEDPVEEGGTGGGPPPSGGGVGSGGGSGDGSGDGSGAGGWDTGGSGPDAGGWAVSTPGEAADGEASLSAEINDGRRVIQRASQTIRDQIRAVRDKWAARTFGENSDGTVNPNGDEDSAAYHWDKHVR